jgi:hypothetical protein
VTTWNIFPATNGPAAATVLAGNYVAGMMWKVSSPGLWLYGYRWWCCNTGQDTSSKKCALWNPKSSTGGDGALIPGSTAFTGTLTPGAWNTALLATPIPVSLNTPYLAAVAQNGSFPFTVSQFGPAQPFASGIVQGPLVAYSDSSLGATVNATPYTLPQGCFTTAVADPTLAMPATGNNSFNSWVDVIVSDVPPPGFNGPYSGWPSKYDLDPAAANDNAATFNLAYELDLARPCLTGNAFFWSIPGATSLPTAVGIWSVATQQLVAQQAAPVWLNALTGAAGAAGGGKMRTAFPATLLPAGKYRVSVYNSAGAGGTWSPRVFGYFLTGGGGGAGGVTWGPLTIPAQGNAQNAYVYQGANPGSTPPFTDGHTQEPSNGTFAPSTFTYPYAAVDFNLSVGSPAGAIAEWFGIDLELTPVATAAGNLLLPGQP